MASEKRLIDANAMREDWLENGENEHVYDTNAVLDSIDAQPTVDAVEVVHGRWIHCSGKSNLWYCSECGEKILYNPTRRTYNIEKRPVHEVNKYCRGCGAIMNGGNADGICKED